MAEPTARTIKKVRSQVSSTLEFGPTVDSGSSLRAPQPIKDLSDRSGIFARPSDSSAASVRHASSIDNQEHVADIMRLRMVMSCALVLYPNTIRVFDFGITEDGLWYYAMELLEGETLASLIDREGPLPAERALRLIRQACRAMAEAHGRNIIHRDIKPDNLFLTTLGGETDFIKVLDFGIVKLMDEELRHSGQVTGVGSLLGTPAYMSPEQFEGQGIDARTDVFSLGAVLYFLLTAEPPYRGTTMNAIRAAHFRPVDPPSRRGPLPILPELERIVLRCLEREPTRRYPSAAELDETLAAVEKILPTLLPAEKPASAQHSASTDEYPVTGPAADRGGIFKKTSA